MKTNKIALIIILILVLPLMLKAQAEPTKELDKKLSLKQVLKAGIENNFSLKLKKSEIRLFEGRAQTSKGRFNPFVNINLKSNNGNDPTITYSDMYNAETEFVLPTKFGVSFYTGFDITKETILEPAKMTNNIAGGFIGFNLPLLKFGGNYSSGADYDGAMLRLTAESTAFSHQITEFIRDAATSYLVLYQDASIFRLLEKRLRFIKEYRDNIELLIKNEQIPRAEILRADAIYNKVLIGVTDSEKSLQESYYKLFKLLGYERTLEMMRVPVFEDDEPNFNESYFNAFADELLKNSDSLIKNRLDYLSAEQRKSGIKRELEGAANQKHHDLDFGVAVNYFGYSRGNSEMFSTMTGKFPGPSITLSLKYKFPFQNDSYEGAYIQKLAEFESERIGQEQLAFEVKNLMISSARNLIFYTRLSSAQITNVDLYRKTYLNEHEKFKMGLATQIDVLNSMEDYFDEEIKLENYKTMVGINLVVLKYLAGKLPSDSEKLERFNLWSLE